MDVASESIDWAEMNNQWESSGLSQEKFCESRDMVYSTFVYHRGRILEEKKKTGLSGFSRVRVMPVIEPKHAGSLILRLPTGIGLEIGSGSDMTQLKCSSSDLI